MTAKTTAQRKRDELFARLGAAADAQEFARIWNIEIAAIGPVDGRAPGFPEDLQPGATYYNGYHFLTKADDGSTCYTDKTSLPPAFLSLWEQVGRAQRREDDFVREAERQTAERNRVGRPEVGRAVEIRMPDWLIREIDLYAERHNLKRAEAIRRMINAGLRQLKEAESQ